MTQPPQPAGFPQRFKQYRVVRILGQGGMGTVYEGVDERIGQRVAIKVLHPHLAAADPSYAERFEREAHVAALLRSPYTVHLLDFGVQDGQYFLVMEYIEGHALSDYLRQGPLDVNRALWVAGEVARALEEAEARGIVHRDIKPDNILFDQDGRVKVTDFGIARSLNSGGVTQAGSFVGTPAYAAPEQIDGNVDHRSDIYALGITLYAMLTGRPPYEGTTPMDTMLQHRVAPLPTQAIAHLPHSVQSIVRRATEKDPLDRYQTAAEMAGAIDRARQTLSRDSQAPVAAPVPPVSAGAATQSAPPPVSRPVTPSADIPTLVAGRPAGPPPGAATPAGIPAAAGDPAAPPKRRRNVVYYYAGGMVAGIAVAIGISLYLAGGGGGGGDDGPAATATTAVPVVGTAADYEVTAVDFTFDRGTLTAPPNTAVTYVLINEGGARHSLQFKDRQGGQELAPGATGPITEGGETATVSFTTPGPGTYYFECANHPSRMNGTFEVKEGAPAPPRTQSAGGGDGATDVEISATDFAFSVATIEAVAGDEVTVRFTNNDSAPHSVQFRTERGGPELVAGATGERIGQGETDTFTFVAPGPGTYHFECGVHPAQMNGTFVVKEAGSAATTTATPEAEEVTFNIVATDFAFDHAELDAESGAQVTINLRNNGAAPHSIQFRRDNGELAAGATGRTISGGETDTIRFTAPSPGTYRFECGVHPARMNGRFVVHSADGAAGTATPLPSVTPPIAVSRLSSGARVTVVQPVNLTAQPTGQAGVEVLRRLEPGDTLIVVTNTPPSSTFHQTEGLLFWRLLVEGTSVVGWAPEVAVSGSPRWLDLAE